MGCCVMRDRSGGEVMKLNAFEFKIKVAEGSSV